MILSTVRLRLRWWWRQRFHQRLARSSFYRLPRGRLWRYYWQERDMEEQSRSGCPTPTTDGKYIYVLVDNGILNCVEAATGKVVYEGKRIEHGTYSASPLLADGKLYCINEDGTTSVVKAGPEFEVLAVNKLDGLTLASPIAVDDEIFIRTADYLYCIRKK